MTPMSPQQKALFLAKKQGNFEIRSRSIPSPGTGQLLVKVQSTALNPVDYKIKETGMFVTHYPAILGSDIAGIVEEVGEGVENFRRGDNVLAHGTFTNDLAAFQQYTLTVASFTAKIPSNLSFDSAATVPLGFDTALTGMYGKHNGAGITPPWEEGGSHDNTPDKPIVIIGGSSSVGSYAIQLACLSGFYPVIATASAYNERLVRNYGATHFFDRHLSGSQLKEAISRVTDRPIGVVYDAISLPETQPIGWGLLANNGILVLTLSPSVKEDEGKGRKVISTSGSPHMPQNKELGRNAWAMVEEWLSEGDIQPNKYENLSDGLEGIIDGLVRMKNGEVSGTKLVAHPQETR
ncbi:GroES-like protein [Rhizopogon vinicolor AM-OR11-026]|uniref:GroES-like protein n=1 Tax=Rhizopogon vinicolor AM-OR11-026 TaxID=1314800 RepID=A0A1B7ND13_9AGAM|nr:GroES-like protein [Rhizopogon vinicolor AM-OR11-026]